MPFFDKIISRQGFSPDPAKVNVLTDMPPTHNTKENCQSFLGIVNYLKEVLSNDYRKYANHSTGSHHVNAEWVWNGTYQEVYRRAKLMVRQDTCMKYYNVR